MQDRPFDEWDHILVPSSYGVLNGVKRYYRVVFGTVKWHTSDPGAIHRACFPIVQFGNTSNYESARRKGEIKELYPCHILEEDMDQVIAAMNELRNKFLK